MQDMLINIPTLSSFLYKMVLIVASYTTWGNYDFIHIKSSEFVPDIVKTQELLALLFIITISLPHKKKHMAMALILTAGFRHWKLMKIAQENSS